MLPLPLPTGANDLPEPSEWLEARRLRGGWERELRKINQKMQTAIIVHHEAFKNGDDFLEVHAVERWFKLQVGALELIFTPEEVSDLDTAMGEEEEGPEMPAIILQTVNAGAQVNVDKVLGLPGVEVDDDHEPDRNLKKF